MAINLEIKFTPGDRQKTLSLLDPKRYEWAMRQSLNRTATNVAKFGHAKVAKAMGVPKSKLYKRGRRTFASGKFGAVGKGKRATRRKLEAEVKGVGRPFNVTRWNASEIPGVGTKHSAYGREQVAPRTWMLNVAGRPVVKRSQGKIKGVFGPGVAQQMEKPEILKPMQAFTNRRFRHHWRSRLAYAFESRGMPRG